MIVTPEGDVPRHGTGTEIGTETGTGTETGGTGRSGGVVPDPPAGEGGVPGRETGTGRDPEIEGGRTGEDGNQGTLVAIQSCFATRESHASTTFLFN